MENTFEPVDFSDHFKMIGDLLLLTECRRKPNGQAGLGIKRASLVERREREQK